MTLTTRVSRITMAKIQRMISRSTFTKLEIILNRDSNTKRIMGYQVPPETRVDLTVTMWARAIEIIQTPIMAWTNTTTILTRTQKWCWISPKMTAKSPTSSRSKSRFRTIDLSTVCSKTPTNQAAQFQARRLDRVALGLELLQAPTSETDQEIQMLSSRTTFSIRMTQI